MEAGISRNDTEMENFTVEKLCEGVDSLLKVGVSYAESLARDGNEGDAEGVLRNLSQIIDEAREKISHVRREALGESSPFKFIDRLCRGASSNRVVVLSIDDERDLLEFIGEDCDDSSNPKETGRFVLLSRDGLIVGDLEVGFLEDGSVCSFVINRKEN